MEINGTVKDGVIVVDPSIRLPEGARVMIRIEPAAQEDPPRDPSRPTTLGERLMKHAGTLSGMPPDFAEQHDHYIHGTPKR